MTPEIIYRVSQDAMIVAIKLTAPVLIAVFGDRPYYCHVSGGHSD